MKYTVVKRIHFSHAMLCKVPYEQHVRTTRQLVPTCGAQGEVLIKILKSM